MNDEQLPSTPSVTYTGPSPSDTAEPQVRLSVRLREFDLPPVRDGVLVSRRAPIGPRALFEALDRMLPDTYELIPIQGHPTVEAAVVRKSRLRLVSRERLVNLLVRYSEALLNGPTIVQFEIDGEVSVQVDFARG